MKNKQKASDTASARLFFQATNGTTKQTKIASTAFSTDTRSPQTESFTTLAAPAIHLVAQHIVHYQTLQMRRHSE